MNQDLSTCLLSMILRNFSLAMLILALIFIIFHRLFKRSVPQGDIAYRWIALFPLGLTGIYAFIMHAFYPVISAISIGWIPSPFQFEVAVANLAIGVIGILSFNARYGFRLATVIAATIFLWGAAIGHLYQTFRFHNFANGNAGSWLVMDIVVPILLIICIVRLRKEQ